MEQRRAATDGTDGGVRGVNCLLHAHSEDETVTEARQPANGTQGIELDEFREQLRTHPQVASPRLEVIDLGDEIVIAGTVADVDRRRAVDEVAAQLAPGRKIDNRVRVGEPHRPPDDKLETQL